MATISDETLEDRAIAQATPREVLLALYGRETVPARGGA